MQPCQPQEPVQRPQAGRPWDSSVPLNYEQPLDDSGDFLLESLFPEFYDLNGSGDLWDVGNTAAMQHSGLVQGGLYDSQYFSSGVYGGSGYGVDVPAFGAMEAGEMSTGRTVSPTSSAAPIISTLPTPASISTSEKQSSKKRTSSDIQSARTTSPQSETSPEPADKIVKRQRNTEAARRYRQRKVDRVTELEEALAAMTKERDDFKLKLARSEAEVDVLRRLVGKGS